MFATLVTVTLFAAAAINGAAAQSDDLAIATPSMTTCQPVDITWTGGTGPFDLIAVPASDPCGDALVDWGVLNNNSVSYTPNLAAGTQIELSIEDSTGFEAWSGTITIGQGSDTSCVTAAAASSSGTSPTGTSSIASSSASSSDSVAVTGTTLLVTGTAATSAAASSASSNAGPLGAVGNNGPLEASSNGAMAHATSPFMLLSAVAGLLILSL